MNNISKVNFGIMSQTQNNNTPLRFNSDEQIKAPITSENAVTEKYSKRNNLYTAGIDFLTCFAALALIHVRNLTRTKNYLFAGISALYAAIHYRVSANTPGRFILSKILESNNSKKSS